MTGSGELSENADGSPQQARAALRKAHKDLQERGLVMAARWAAELLQAVPASTPQLSGHKAAQTVRTSTPNKPRPSLPNLLPNVSIAPAAEGGPSSPIVDANDLSSFAFSPESMRYNEAYTAAAETRDALEEQETDEYILGKAYYDTKELDRAAQVLKSCKSSRARFLCLYCRYLVCSSSSLVRLLESNSVRLGWRA